MPPPRISGITIAAPDPLRQLVATRFAVTVTGARGEPVNNAQVRLALEMPGMPMPPNVVSCAKPPSAAPPGYYVGVGTFTMTGTWRIDASALIPGGNLLKATRMAQVR